MVLRRKQEREGKVLKAQNKWNREKTWDNKYEIVEMKEQYKAIMEIKKKEWQGKSEYNIKVLLKKSDVQQLWKGIRMLPQVQKQRKEADLVNSREYFRGLLSMGTEERK